MNMQTVPHYRAGTVHLVPQVTVLTDRTWYRPVSWLFTGVHQYHGPSCLHVAKNFLELFFLRCQLILCWFLVAITQMGATVFAEAR